MKKSGLVLIFVLLLGFFCITFVLAANPTDALENANNQIQAGVDKADDLGNKANSGVSYVFEEWKKIILENPFVRGINSLLTGISFIFVILLGQPYSLSLVFAFSIVFWFFFFSSLKKLFKTFSPFSPVVSLAVSICLTIALAQLGLYSLLANLCIKLAFMFGNTLVAIIIFVGIIIGLFFVSRILKFVYFGGQKNKEKIEKEKEKANRRALDHFITTITEGNK
ncbi:MAG: hypothetical protein AABW63_02625 [Nanoarchaeota archaeon]